MGKFWRALNLPLVLFIFLLLLQGSICCLRYGYDWLGLDFSVKQSRPTVPPSEWGVQFTSPSIRLMHVVVDCVRPGLLVLALCSVKPLELFASTALLMLLYQNDFKSGFSRWSNSQLVPPEFTVWEINWNYNPLFRLSLLYEIVVRVFVIVVLINYFLKSRSESTSAATFRFSIADLLLLISLIAFALGYIR